MQGLKRIAVICAATMLVSGCGGGGPQPTQRKQPPNNGAVQKVLLIWQQNAWMVQLPGKQPELPATATSKIDPGIGPTVFEITIQGSTNATFKTDGLSVWEGAGKKASPKSGINSTQIVGPFVSQNGKTLTFVDLNYGDPVTLNYALHFNQPTVPSVDPIVENGGGNWE